MALSRVSLAQGGITLNDLGIGLRLGLHLGSESGREFLPFGGFSGFNKSFDPPGT